MKQHASVMRDAGEAALAAAGAKGFSQSGRTGMPDKRARRALGSYAKGKGEAYWLAQTYALLGDRAHALSFLAVSVSRREPETIAMAIDPALDSLRGDPRVHQAPCGGRLLAAQSCFFCRYSSRWISPRA